MLTKLPDSLQVKRHWYWRRDPTREYLDLELVCNGGVCDIYRAIDQQECCVALKILKPSYRRSRRRIASLYREMYVLSLLNHPQIVSFFEGGTTHDHLPYVCLEWLEGSPLRNVLGSEIISTSQIVRILRDILNALGEVHHHGLVHLDLKPDNVFLVRSDGHRDWKVAKLLDFGSVRPAVSPKASRVQKKWIQATAPAATPSYASPDLLNRYIHRDTSPLEFRTDLFSVGIFAFELATSELPYSLPRKRRSWPRYVRTFCERELAGKLDMVPKPIDDFVQHCLSGYEFTTTREALDWLRENAESGNGLSK